MGTKKSSKTKKSNINLDHELMLKDVYQHIQESSDASKAGTTGDVEPKKVTYRYAADVFIFAGMAAAHSISARYSLLKAKCCSEHLHLSDLDILDDVQRGVWKWFDMLSELDKKLTNALGLVLPTDVVCSFFRDDSNTNKGESLEGLYNLSMLIYSLRDASEHLDEAAYRLQFLTADGPIVAGGDTPETSGYPEFSDVVREIYLEYKHLGYYIGRLIKSSYWDNCLRLTDSMEPAYELEYGKFEENGRYERFKRIHGKKVETA